MCNSLFIQMLHRSFTEAGFFPQKARPFSKACLFSYHLRRRFALWAAMPLQYQCTHVCASSPGVLQGGLS